MTRAMEQQEHRQRIDTLARNARTAGMAGVLLSSESNVTYYTGFRHHAPWSVFARPCLFLVAATGPAALVAHDFLATEMWRAGAVQDLRTYTRSGSMPVQLVADAMRELGMAGGKVGAELGDEQRLGVSWQDFAALCRALPATEFADASKLIWRQRMIKSPAEIGLMRQAVEMTNRAFEACFAAVQPGITEKEIARIAAETMIRQGADRPGFVLVVSGVGNYQRLSGQPTDRKLERGDMLWIDMGAVCQGYWADFCRAAVLGEPSREQQKTQAILLQVNQACLDAVRVGEPVRRVAEAAEAAWQAHGVGVRIGEGRIGHGMGLMATEPPHVALYEETPMEEGLLFTIEPRVVTDAGIFNCEEEIVVTTTGAEVITTAPRELAIAG